MPIHHTIWRVDETPQPLPAGKLPSESMLEQMIVAAPQIVSPDWLIIGQQVMTDSGGRVDLLALAPDGSVILIELKRNQTSRDVVAQALDYATWVETLPADELTRIYTQFSPGGNLDEAFRARFGQSLDEVNLNENHQIVIVAASLDACSERIVNYLNDRDIAINVLFFQVFDTPHGQLLSRAWLRDPVESQLAASSSDRSGEKEPWNGEYYANFDRSWDEAVTHGFISAGGGTWYSGTLKLLKPGDRVWVRVPGKGFVGVGRVRHPAVPLAEFQLPGSDGTPVPALNVLTQAKYHAEHIDDPEKCEYFVAIDWADTVPVANAFNEIGLFGNTNSVCAPKTPKWRHTIDRLKQHFPNYDSLK